MPQSGNPWFNYALKTNNRRKTAACAAVVTGAALLFPAHGGLSTTAYYAAWMQDHLQAGQVDFSALTHIIHCAVVPNHNGTLDSEINLVTKGHSADLVAGARAAGTKVLISIGGGESAAGFRGACSSANLSHFITNIVTLTRSRGYDGVDLDWEPLGRRMPPNTRIWSRDCDRLWMCIRRDSC